jgi:hypothetical protein
MNEKLFQKFVTWMTVVVVIFACINFISILLQGRFSEILAPLPWIIGFAVILLVLAFKLPRVFKWVGDLIDALYTAYLKFLFNSLLVFLPVYVFSRISNWMASLEIFWLQVLSLVLWGVALCWSIWVLIFEKNRIWFLKWLRERISGFAPWAYSFNLIWIGVFFFASLTYILVNDGIIPLEPSGSAQFSLDIFLNFYTWHFLKAIPGFAITDTLHWKEPLTYESGWIGLLLLTFKIIVISPIIGAFIWYWRFVGKEEKNEAERRLRKTVHRTYRPKRRVLW